MDEKIKKTSDLYLTRAYEFLDDAEFCFISGRLKTCINRAYYCIFHCMNACIIINGYEFSKHTAVISKFRELFIKYELLPEKLSSIINKLFNERNLSDYDITVIPDNITAEYCLKSARFFYDEVKKYLEEI